MENVAKVLQIAAGVLVAVMILSLVSYFFLQLSFWPEEQDKAEDAEQIAKFNKEYEVYQKSVMYGVDVVSCLNKAQSNNEKYAESKKFFTGSHYGQYYDKEKDTSKKFYVNIYVHMESALEENLRIFYISDVDLHQKEDFTTKADNPGGTKPDDRILPPGKGDYVVEEKKLADIGFDLSSDYTSLEPDSPLYPVLGHELTGDKYLEKNGGIEMLYPGATQAKNYYSLRPIGGGDEDPDNPTQLKRLLNLLSEDGNMVVIKSNNAVSLKNSDTKESYKYWSQVMWETALYDFKKKKFKCEYVGYNKVSGRVNEMYFSEVTLSKTELKPTAETEDPGI